MPRDADDANTARTSKPPAARNALQHWLIFTGLTVFGFVLLWNFGLLRRMVVADRTYISSIIVILYLGATLHCLWRTIALSREQDAAREVDRLLVGDPDGLAIVGETVATDAATARPDGLVAGHIRDLVQKSERQGGRRLDQTLLLRGLAVRLRGSNQFGGFASDTLMKLGLVGTIIGFIIMLSPIAGLDPGDRGALRSSMSVMSDGMAVAMYTTLAGLVGSILLKIQYYMLDSATADLFAASVRLVELHVVPALERRGLERGSNFPE